MTRRATTAETPRRKSATAANVREMLLMQAYETGNPIICPLCYEPILPGDKTIREHMHALGLGGLDAPDNWRLVHKPCAARKTHGTKATTAGSDIQQIAKGKRLRGETGQGRPKRKIQGRGFDKTKTRRVDGIVVPRN